METTYGARDILVVKLPGTVRIDGVHAERIADRSASRASASKRLRGRLCDAVRVVRRRGRCGAWARQPSNRHVDEEHPWRVEHRVLRQQSEDDRQRNDWRHR